MWNDVADYEGCQWLVFVWDLKIKWIHGRHGRVLMLCFNSQNQWNENECRPWWLVNSISVIHADCEWC